MAQYKLAGDWDTAALTLTKMGEIFRKQGRHGLPLSSQAQITIILPSWFSYQLIEVEGGVI